MKIQQYILDSKEDLKYAGYLQGDISKIKMDVYTTYQYI